MIRPIDHVCRGVAHPIEHLKTFGIVLVMAGVKIDGVAIDHRRRIGGELRLDDRIIRKTHRPQNGYSGSDSFSCESLNSRLFHAFKNMNLVCVCVRSGR